jgi:hypothetical protein
MNGTFLALADVSFVFYVIFSTDGCAACNFCTIYFLQPPGLDLQCVALGRLCFAGWLAA